MQLRRSLPIGGRGVASIGAQKAIQRWQIGCGGRAREPFDTLANGIPIQRTIHPHRGSTSKSGKSQLRSVRMVGHCLGSSWAGRASISKAPSQRAEPWYTRLFSLHVRISMRQRRPYQISASSSGGRSTTRSPVPSPASWHLTIQRLLSFMFRPALNRVQAGIMHVFPKLLVK